MMSNALWLGKRKSHPVYVMLVYLDLHWQEVDIVCYRLALAGCGYSIFPQLSLILASRFGMISSTCHCRAGSEGGFWLMKGFGLIAQFNKAIRGGWDVK